jgi:hypothetical protein
LKAFCSEGGTPIRDDAIVDAARGAFTPQRPGPLCVGFCLSPARLAAAESADVHDQVSELVGGGFASARSDQAVESP